MYKEAFQDSGRPRAKPAVSIIEKLNALAFNGPAGNQAYFKSLLGVKEGFSAASLSLADMNAAAGVEITPATTPATFRAKAGSTPSVIDQLEEFYTDADTEYKRILGEVRSYIWTKVSAFQAIVGNVSALGLALSGDALTINSQTDISGQSVDTLVDTWNSYTGAMDPGTGFIKQVNDEIALKKVPDYRALYNKYKDFIVTPSIGGIDQANPNFTLESIPVATPEIPATLPPTLTLDGNYTGVSTYFTTGTGHFDKLVKYVGDELYDWEGEYYEQWNALPANVKTQYPYVRPTPPTLIKSMTSGQLISLMNRYLGIADAGEPTPSALATDLQTGTILVQALASVRTFFKTLIDNMVVFKSISDISGTVTGIETTPYTIAGVSITPPLQSGITLQSLVTEIGTISSQLSAYEGTTLTQTNRETIAGIKARFDAGDAKLKADARTQLTARIADYNALNDLSVAVAGVGSLHNGSSDSVTEVNFVSLRDTYAINHFYNIVNAFQSKYTAMSTENQGLFDSTTILTNEEKGTVPALVATLTGTFQQPATSWPVGINEFTTDVFNNTVVRAQTLANAIVELTTELRKQLNYRNKLIKAIFNKLYSTLIAAPYNFTTDNTSVTDAYSVSPYTDISEGAALLYQYNTFKNVLVAYANHIISETGATSISFSDLSSYLNSFVSNIRGRVQTRITDFLGIYDSIFREALNEYRTKMDPALAATRVCNKSGSELPIKCADERVATETLQNSSIYTTFIGTFNSGYVFADYSANSSANIFDSLKYYLKFDALISAASSLKTLLTGIKGVRARVIRYLTKYVNDYAPHKDFINGQVTADSSELTNFMEDISNAKVYFPNIDNFNNTSLIIPLESDSPYYTLDENQLKTTFDTYASGVDKQPDDANEGSAYRNMLTLFAKAVSNRINKYKNDLTSADNAPTLEIRKFNVSGAISIANVDMSTLSSNTVTYSIIVEIKNKYIGINGLVGQLETELVAGNETAQKRLKVKNAITAFKNIAIGGSFGSLFSGVGGEEKLAGYNVSFNSNNSQYQPHKNATSVFALYKFATIYLDSSNDITDALKALSNDELDTVMTRYYAAIPAPKSGDSYLPNYDIPFSPIPTSVMAIPATASLILNIKMAIANVIFKFKSDYDDYKKDGIKIWDYPKIKDASPGFIDVNYRNVDDTVISSINNLSSANSEVQIREVLRNYVNYANNLPEQAINVNDLLTARENAQTALITDYGVAYVVFSGTNPQIVDNSSLESNYLTYVSGTPAVVTDAFNGLNVEDLNEIKNIYSKDGTNNAYTALFQAAGAAIKTKIDSLAEQYKGASISPTEAPSVFKDVLATTERLDRYAPMYSTESAIDAQVATDKGLIDGYVTAKRSSDMLVIWEKYMGDGSVPGYIADLARIIDDLRTSRGKRMSAQEALVLFYSKYHPFSGKLLKTPYSYGPLNTLNNDYLTYDPDGVNYTLRPEFFAKDNVNTKGDANLDLEDIAAQYSALVPDPLPASSAFPTLIVTDSPTPPTQPNSPARPPITEPFIKEVRWQMYNRIRNVVIKYNEYSQYFGQPGVTVDEDLKYPNFSSMVATDVASLHTATFEQLQALQTKYFYDTDISLDIITRIVAAGGPLARTKNLRENILTSAQVYNNLYNDFIGDVLNMTGIASVPPSISTMDADRFSASCPLSLDNANQALNCYYNSSDASLSGIYTISSNAILECINLKFSNPATFPTDGLSPSTTCTDSLTNNAYTRLLTAIKDAMIVKINKYVADYNAQKANIEIPGKSIHIDLQYSITTKPATGKTFPTEDKDSLTGLTGADLYNKLISLQRKYYTNSGTSGKGLFTLLRDEAAGGGELAAARNDLDAKIREFKEMYDAVSVPGGLFNSSEFTPTISADVSSAYNILIGASITTPNKYYYNDAGSLSRTNFYNSTFTTKTVADNKKADYDRHIATLLGNIRTSLDSAVAAFKSKYDANSSLFTNMNDATKKTGWSLSSQLQTAKALSTGFTASTKSLEDCKDLQGKFLTGYTDGGYGNLSYFAQLSTAVVEATAAQARYNCRQSMIQLSDLYEAFKTIVSKPAELRTAEGYMSQFVDDASKYTLMFNALSAASINTFKGEVDAAITGLKSAIATALTSLRTSYNTLRQAYDDFYGENKDAYAIPALPTVFGTGGDKADVLNGGSTPTLMKAVYDAYYERFQALIGFIQIQFNDVIGAPSGVITKYEDKYKYYYEAGEGAPTPRVRISAPAVYAAPTRARDRSIVAAPVVAASDLAQLLADFNIRFDELRLTDARWAAVLAMQAYLDNINRYGSLAEDEKKTTLFTDMRDKYIYLDGDSGQPTYPFRPEFVDIRDETEYGIIADIYEQATLTFSQRLVGGVVTLLNDLASQWPRYWPVKSQFPLTNGDMMEEFYDGKLKDKTPSDITALANLIVEDSPISFGSFSKNGIELVGIIQTFIKDLKLLFLSQQYKNCIANDLRVRNQRISTPNQAFSALVLEKPRDFLSRAMGQIGDFVDYGLHQQQQQGTSRWSFI